MRKAFNFYISFYHAACDLVDTERLEFYDAIIKYQLFGVEPELKKMSRMARIMWQSQKHISHQQLTGYLRAKNMDTGELETPSGSTSGSTSGIPSEQEQEQEKVKEEEKVKEKEKEKAHPRKAANPSGLAESDLIYWFDVFWDAYGKKKEREKCFHFWRGLKIEEMKKIGEVAPVYVAATPTIQYRKNPLTWLRGRCWNDEFVISEFSKPAESKYGTGFDGKPYKFTPDF